MGSLQILQRAGKEDGGGARVSSFRFLRIVVYIKTRFYNAEAYNI